MAGAGFASDVRPELMEEVNMICYWKYLIWCCCFLGPVIQKSSGEGKDWQLGRTVCGDKYTAVSREGLYQRQCQKQGKTALIVRGNPSQV